MISDQQNDCQPIVTMDEEKATFTREGSSEDALERPTGGPG